MSNIDIHTSMIGIVQCPPCPYCKVRGRVVVPVQGYHRWVKGDLIQNAMPELSADHREMLLTGTHSACWDKMFGLDEEE